MKLEKKINKLYKKIIKIYKSLFKKNIDSNSYKPHTTKESPSFSGCSKEQIKIFKMIKPGDLVYAKMPLTEKQLLEIPKGHRTRPYYVIEKKEDYLKAYPSSSSPSKRLDEVNSFVLSNYLYDELEKDSYLNLTQLSDIKVDNIIKFICHVKNHDQNEIQRRLDIKANKTSITEGDQKDAIPGDVIRYNKQSYVVVAVIGDYYRVVKIHSKGNKGIKERFYVTMNNVPYRIIDSESRNLFIKKKDTIRTNKIIKQGEINKIYVYLNKYGGYNCIPKGHIFKTNDNKYYYSYGCYDNKTQAYRAYKAESINKAININCDGINYYIDVRKEQIVKDFSDVHYISKQLKMNNLKECTQTTMSKEQEKALLEFDDYFRDCAFVEPHPNEPQIRIRDAYEKVKKLERPLTKEELKEFVIPLSKK